ncbi:MAG: cysteine--tRNA ligase [Phycisphaerales bacterium]
MSLKLNNTLSRGEQVFAPIEAGRVLFYTCGPTVYDFAHIGNFRSFLAADLLRRWLESPLCERANPDGTPERHAFGEGGYQVTHVMNITDVGHMTDDDAPDGGGEDKMELARQRLLEEKKSGKLPEGAIGEGGRALDPNDPRDIAAFYADAFLEDAKKLGLKVVVEASEDPSLMPRPTQMIPQMLAMICELIDSGHAYVASDGVCYFDTQSFPDYGKLSGNTLDAIRSGAGGRVSDESQAVKKHPADFMLWKPDPRHLMRWDPRTELAGNERALAVLERHPLGEGYPGWHIECSAMAKQRLGSRIDLHSGGEDNIFPHHECEIAQSRCATGEKSFANFWFHPRFLQVEGEKMSKSKGNFFTARDLFAKGFSPAALRLSLINTHYRTNANFTQQDLKDAQRRIERWAAFIESGEASGRAGERHEPIARRFAEEMNGDLNIAGALGVINGWIRDTPDPTRADAALMRLFDGVLGVLEIETGALAGGNGDDAEIDALVDARTQAKADRNWPEADRIRDELASRGIEVTDTPNGPVWKRTVSL